RCVRRNRTSQTPHGLPGAGSGHREGTRERRYGQKFPSPEGRDPFRGITTALASCRHLRRRVSRLPQLVPERLALGRPIPHHRQSTDQELGESPVALPLRSFSAGHAQPLLSAVASGDESRRLSTLAVGAARLSPDQYAAPRRYGSAVLSPRRSSFG